jgi:hypothetical protein
METALHGCARALRRPDEAFAKHGVGPLWSAAMCLACKSSVDNGAYQALAPPRDRSCARGHEQRLVANSRDNFMQLAAFLGVALGIRNRLSCRNFPGRSRLACNCLKIVVSRVRFPGSHRKNSLQIGQDFAHRDAAFREWQRATECAGRPIECQRCLDRPRRRSRLSPARAMAGVPFVVVTWTVR